MHVEIPVFVRGATKEGKERKFHRCATERDRPDAPPRTYRIDVPVEIEEVAAAGMGLAVEVTGRDLQGVASDESFLSRGGTTYAPVRAPTEERDTGPFRHLVRGEVVPAADFVGRLARGAGKWPPVRGGTWNFGYDPDEQGWRGPIPTPEEADVRTFEDGGLVARAEAEARSLAGALLSVDGSLHVATPPPLYRVGARASLWVSTRAVDDSGATPYHPDESDWFLSVLGIEGGPRVHVHDPSVYGGERSADALRREKAAAVLRRAGRVLENRTASILDGPALHREAVRLADETVEGRADPRPHLAWARSALTDLEPADAAGRREVCAVLTECDLVRDRFDAHTASLSLDALDGASPIVIGAAP